MKTAIRKIIEGTTLPWRGDCPSCGGKNTLSIQRVNGDVVYNCFRASCNVKGNFKSHYSITELLNRNNDANKPRITYNFFPVASNESAYALVKDLNAYKDARIQVQYDPAKHRIVFASDSVIIGKTLANAKPKWLLYEGSTGEPYLINHESRESRSLILCEDILSAAVCSDFADSAALLGTRLSLAAKTLCLNYDRVIIALDPDAYYCGYKIAKKLAGLVKTSLLLLPADPKDMEYHELSEIIHNTLTEV